MVAFTNPPPPIVRRTLESWFAKKAKKIVLTTVHGHTTIYISSKLTANLFSEAVENYFFGCPILLTENIYDFYFSSESGSV